MATPTSSLGDIAVRARTLEHLFSPLDPSPMGERDLAPAVDEHIVGWARELPHRAPIRIAIDLPVHEIARPASGCLPEALSDYFASRARAAAREQRELFRVGRMSLLIGTTVLVLCLVASQLLAPAIPEPTLARLAEESFVLVGWVANWRPLEIYLYDWWPIRRRRRLFERLAAADVLVRPAPERT